MKAINTPTNVNDLQFDHLTLTLNWHQSNMGSAHCLAEVNICAKYVENPSINIGFRDENTKLADRWRDALTNGRDKVIPV